MKKKFLIIVFAFIILLGYINEVEALNVVKKVDGIIYTITTVSNMDSCKVNDTKTITSNYSYDVNGIIGIVDDRKAVFYDSSSKEFYLKDLIKNECKKVDSSDEKKLLSDMKQLYSRGDGGGPGFWIESNGDVFKEWASRFFDFGNSQGGYYLTKDEQLVSGKSYYENNDGTMTIVASPNIDNINNYYEIVIFAFYPTIDSNKTYYKRIQNSQIYEEVDNPTWDDILLYRIKAEGTSSKIAQIDLKKFPNVAEFFADDMLPTTVTKIGKKNIYKIWYDNGVKFYNEDGTIYKEEKGFSSILVGGINGTALYLNNSNKYLLDSNGTKIFDFSKENGNFVSEECDIDINLQEGLYLNTGLNDGLGVTESTVLYILGGDDQDVYFGPEALKVTAYYPKKGNDQTFNKENLVFTFSGELELLNKVLLNGEELDEKYYTTKSGSTIITINKDYLANLKSGNYTLKVEYNDGGYTSADFSIPEANPKTIDSVVAYFIITIISIVGIISVFAYKKRYN